MEATLLFILVCVLVGLGFLFEISLLLRELIRILGRIEERLNEKNGGNQ
jgi:hypothetical protein